ncbi:hypothetical protein ABS642_00670 [Microbacterium sp. A8/3-1]|uniref:Lipoprotein n=1 Tax=Microbacterium sp. A8/3-1 TaxID=3160749 RepID=A0AAU7VXU2_9MICO
MMRINLGRLAITCALGAVIACSVTGCASASLESAAEDCGGEKAGLIADETGMVVEISSGTDGLVCVLPKIFGDQAEQYAVAMIADEGVGATGTIDERDIKVVTVGGGTVVFIEAK